MAVAERELIQRTRTTEFKVPAEVLKRGEIYYADLSPVTGSEQGGNCRPVLILQNDIGNKFSTTIIVAIISSQDRGKVMPTYVSMLAGEGGLPKDSIIHLEQVRTIDKLRLLNESDRIGQLSPKKMEEVDRALMVSVGLSRYCR